MNVLPVARCELLRFSWQAERFVTLGVGVGESVLGAVAGRFAVFPRSVLHSRVLRGLPMADLGWGA